MRNLLTYICLALTMQGMASQKAIVEEPYRIKRIDQVDRRERKRHGKRRR